MSAVYKAFVVKNGLEVSTDLILADVNTRRVGVGTTALQYTLHVNGGIGATDLYVSGITTVINELRVGTGGTVFTVLGLGNSIGIGTALPGYLLDIRSPVSTGQTALYVQGDVQVTGDVRADKISITNLNVSGVSTFVGFATFNNILVAGISTFVGFATFRNNILVAGISTFVGFATFNDYVFIQDGLNVTGTGATLASLNVSGVSTFVGFATFSNNIFVTGIGTITTLNSASGTITNLTGTSGTITTLSSTNGTITNLTGTSGTITTLNSTNGNITNLTGTSGTITTVNSASGTITNLTGTSGTITTFNSTSGTITNLVSTSGTITNLTGTSGTITTLNTTNGSITNLNVSGVSTFVGFATFNNILVAGISTFVGLSTFNNLNSQNLNISGISTLNNVFLGGYLSVGGTTGQQNQVLVSTGVGVTWRPNSSLRTSTSFIATPGQTSFSATYSIGFVDVYIIGVKLSNTEFTATNGTSVVLNDSCFGSESVEIIAFNVEYPLTFSGITLQEEGSVVGTGIDAINFVGAAVTAVSVGAGSTIFVNAQLPLTSSSNVVVGIITATGGFVSTANTTPVTIQLVGNQLTFNAVGIGSTTLTLF